jgi:hypothetical protein
VVLATEDFRGGHQVLDPFLGGHSTGEHEEPGIRWNAERQPKTRIACERRRHLRVDAQWLDLDVSAADGRQTPGDDGTWRKYQVETRVEARDVTRRAAAACCAEPRSSQRDYV